MLFDFSQLPSWMRKAHCYDLDKEWETFVGFLRNAERKPRVPFMAPDLAAGFHRSAGRDRALAAMLLDRIAHESARDHHGPARRGRLRQDHARGGALPRR